MPKSFSKKSQEQKLGYRGADFIRRQAIFNIKKSGIKPILYRGTQHRG